MEKKYSEYLIRSVENRDISNIRGALLGIIDKSPQNIDIGELEAALRYVLQSVKEEELFEKNDASFDDSGLVNDYYYVLSSLKQNFSREKFNRVKALGGKRFGSPAPAKAGNRSGNQGNTRYVQNPSRPESTKEKCEREESSKSSFQIGTAIKVGVAVLIAIILLAAVITVLMRIK